MARLKLDPFSPSGVSLVTDIPISSSRQSNGYVAQKATGLITAGSNITITGEGTTSSPYQINSSGGGGGGGSTVWGAITGDLNNQADLIAAFADKADASDLVNYAPLASPALTGNPTAPTASYGDNSTKIANTEFVETAVVEAIDALTIPVNIEDLGNVDFGGGTPTDGQTLVYTEGGGYFALGNASVTGGANYGGGVTIYDYSLTGDPTTMGFNSLISTDGSLLLDNAVPGEVNFSIGLTQLLGRVDHGADANVARPAGYYSIQWVGSVEPVNATANDSWLDTT